MSSLGLLQHFWAIVRTEAETADDDMDNVGEVVVEAVTSLSKLSPKNHFYYEMQIVLYCIVIIY